MHMTGRTFLTATLLALLSTGCAGRQGGSVLSPGSEGYPTPGNLEHGGAVLQQLRSDAGASYHLLHVSGAQAPQRFDADVVMFVVRGELRLTLDGSNFLLVPGDVVEIPRGTQMSTQNIGSAQGKAYLVMSPPQAAGERSQNVSQPVAKRGSAWRWTRWGN
jgi:quercetin dioxygenase-like cupin family protein